MINLQPGPSQLFHSVRDHVRQAFKLRIPEMVPHSAEALELVQQTTRQLRELLGIPDTHEIFFRPETSHYIDEAVHITGDEYAFSASPEDLFSDASIPPDTKLLLVSHTDDRGMSLTSDLLLRLREKADDKLIAVNASLAWPYASTLLDVIDAVFLEFHYGFGLPAGLGALVVNKRWKESFRVIHPPRGTIHPNLNLTWVSVLGGVIGDMLSRSITTIRRETEYKASLLYHLLDQHSFLRPAVSEKAIRSRTIIAAQAAEIGPVQDELRKYAISAGFTEDSVVFANFPSHSKEQYERLADILSGIK